MRVGRIKVVLDKGAYLPERAHEADAGYDLRTREDATIPVGGNWMFDTGVHMAIPKGYVGFLKSKSGLNCRCGITGEGVVDAEYNGSIVVKLYNNGTAPISFKKGNKIIQIVLMPIATPKLKLVDSLKKTSRGNNGFGSTGK